MIKTTTTTKTLTKMTMTKTMVIIIYVMPCFYVMVISFGICYRSFAKAAGCKMTSLKACVKTKSSQEVLDAQSQVFSNPILLPFGPVVDGYFLPGIMWLSRSLKLKSYNYIFVIHSLK